MQVYKNPLQLKIAQIVKVIGSTNFLYPKQKFKIENGETVVFFTKSGNLKVDFEHREINIPTAQNENIYRIKSRVEEELTVIN